MSFDFEKVKAKHEDHSSNSWTAYSDLFLMLSTVFLLLYVAASLRSHNSSVQQNQEYQKLAARAADLEQQIQVYNALRDNQLQQKGSEEEQKVYQKLMSQLTLLQDEAKNEKEDLRKKAKENEEKEYALNEYQKLIRNIINTNVLAKTQIQNRDVTITKKNKFLKEQAGVIASQDEEIQGLNAEIESKQATIAANRKRIQDINKALNKKIADIKNQQDELHLTKKEMNEKIANLQSNSRKKINELEAKNKSTYAELSNAQASLASAQEALEKTEQEKGNLKNQLQLTQQQYDSEVARLRGDHQAKIAQARAEFNASLEKERLTGAERARKIAEFAAAAQRRESELQGQLGDLSQKYQMAESEKGRALAAAEGLAKQNEGLSRENASLSGDLKRAQELANARSNLAKQIKGELARAGLKGTVDDKTGDVTLAFGEEYFDTGSAELKPTMKQTLEKFMPGYSRSLFKDGKVSSQIENVEIVGFASSTYKGRYVPPGSLRPEDQAAVNYNVKLSFDRANSIFKYIFDTKKMSFEHQRDLLPKIKVVGRGYLPDGKSNKDFDKPMSEREFCSQYNCKQAQKVIIKFKLKD